MSDDMYCPDCRAALDIPAGYSGDFRCPRCGEVFSIVFEEQVDELVAVRQRRLDLAFRCLAIIVFGCIFFVPSYFVMQSGREAARQAQSKNNLEQIAQACKRFESLNGHFPPAGADAQGRTSLLSWRVYILEDMGERELFEQFHLDEPWDSPHNKSLIPQMPACYECGWLDLPTGYTNYLAITGPGAVFQGPRPGSTTYKDMGPILADVYDPSATVMVVEVDPEFAVVWTKPDDLQIDENRIRHGLGDQFFDCCFFTIRFDGTVELVSLSESDSTLRKMFLSAP